jgi:hypothetical protein
MSWLKSEAPANIVALVDKIERTADASVEAFSLRGSPSNIGLWALLADGIRRAEDGHALYGPDSNHFNAGLINIGRVLPTGIKWIKKLAKSPSSLARRKWFPAVAQAAASTFDLAREYEGFQTCMPMWHADRYLVDVVSALIVRFTAPSSGRQRQVSAFLKGLRPLTGTWKSTPPVRPDQTPRTQENFQDIFDRATKDGRYGFKYPDPWRLWAELLPEYADRIRDITRRPDSLSLGTYTLGDFKTFYAALLTICAAHEHLCFAWGKAQGLYPAQSGVMVRSASQWSSVLSRLSGLSEATCSAIVADLTFGRVPSFTLHVNPFVELDRSTLNIALAPHFPLHSAPDENILRVCSQLRPKEFDKSSLEKQVEMLATIRERETRFSIAGPVSPPKPNPDIDMFAVDEASSTVVIAELKWIRKTMRPQEYKDRDPEIIKGFGQLKTIKAFLTAEPEHLRSIDKLPTSLAKYKNVHYLLIARDHWLWREPNDGIAIVEFDTFLYGLSKSATLDAGIRSLLSYAWLPVQDQDFTIAYETARVGAVSIQAEVFYEKS